MGRWVDLPGLRVPFALSVEAGQAYARPEGFDLFILSQ
jgi:hypothetical protein